MRKFKVLLCLVAALCASALLLTSCAASKKYEKQVLNYLEDKYEGERIRYEYDTCLEKTIAEFVCKVFRIHHNSVEINCRISGVQPDKFQYWIYGKGGFCDVHSRSFRSLCIFADDSHDAGRLCAGIDTFV